MLSIFQKKFPIQFLIRWFARTNWFTVVYWQIKPGGERGAKIFFKKTLVKTECCQNICIFNRVSTKSYGEIS